MLTTTIIDDRRAWCMHCDWLSGTWPIELAETPEGLATLLGHWAKCEAVWHVYEEHPHVWVDVVGDKPPADPDPRVRFGTESR